MTNSCILNKKEHVKSRRIINKQSSDKSKQLRIQAKLYKSQPMINNIFQKITIPRYECKPVLLSPICDTKQPKMIRLSSTELTVYSGSYIPKQKGTIKTTGLSPRFEKIK